MVAKARAVALSIGYSGRAVVSDVNLSILSGEVLAIVGPNGVGKTTLLRAFGGAVHPLSGEVLLDEKSIAAYPRRRLATKVARVSQSSHADWPFTVGETVMQGRFARLGWFGRPGPGDEKVLRETLERTGLDGFDGRLVTELSGGELQRVMIARALAQEPELLLLDEPVSSLDVKHQVSILELLKSLAREGLAVVASLHDLNLAGLYAHRIALFAEGHLLQVGPPSSILREDLISDAFGVHVLVGSHPDAVDIPSVYHPAPKDEDGQG